MKDGGESPRPFLDLETGQGIGWPGEKVSRDRLPSGPTPAYGRDPSPLRSAGTGRRERPLPLRRWPDPSSPPPARRLRYPFSHP